MEVLLRHMRSSSFGSSSSVAVDVESDSELSDLGLNQLFSPQPSPLRPKSNKVRRLTGLGAQRRATKYLKEKKKVGELEKQALSAIAILVAMLSQVFAVYMGAGNSEKMNCSSCTVGRVIGGLAIFPNLFCARYLLKRFRCKKFILEFRLDVHHVQTCMEMHGLRVPSALILEKPITMNTYGRKMIKLRCELVASIAASVVVGVLGLIACDWSVCWS